MVTMNKLFYNIMIMISLYVIYSAKTTFSFSAGIIFFIYYLRVLYVYNSNNS